MSDDTTQPEVITSFKGFDANFQCRGFQFEVGATYTHEGRVQACNSGFHACENPFDVWGYYPLLDKDAKANRFAIVEQSGEISRHDDDSKIASATITIKAELSLPEFVKRSVRWLIDHCKASGDGERVQASSGDSAQLASSGNFAQLASSGNFAQLASSGNFAQLASSGDSAQLASSGDSAQLASSGDSAQLASSGKDSVIASSGYNAVAKGADGTWIALAEFDDNGKCIGFAIGCIGRDGLEPDTFYRASDGKLVRS